jgi:oligoribonuclease NrnB/cAMP/cGMP phosphodiesterase (DHH superfamily)
MAKTLCIYHGNCADGFTAAWAVREALGEENVDFYAGVYHQDPPDVAGRDVLLVDFSYKRPVLGKMSETARSILVLDHHKSAAEDLAEFPEPPTLTEHSGWLPDSGVYATFDMDRSGAQIAWDHFHQPAGKILARPNLVEYVGDRDLWKFDLPRSREVNAFVFAHEYTFRNWDYLNAMMHDHMGAQCVADMGGAIEKKHHKDVAELVGVCKRMMTIGTGPAWVVPVASLPYTLTSDAGHLMCQPQKNGDGEDWIPGFAACYWDTDDKRIFSLRSVDDLGAVDVSEVAKQYGGGGHRNAAGFAVPRDHELARI